MLKQIALVVGLTFAGSLAAYAGQAMQTTNGSGYESSPSTVMQNGLKKEKPQPQVNGQTATTGGMVDKNPGNVKDNPIPKVNSTSTAQQTGTTEREEGYNKQSAVSSKPSDSN